jgi:ABC-type multidrug transport system fused ATPase/permease subunit
LSLRYTIRHDRRAIGAIVLTSLRDYSAWLKTYLRPQWRKVALLAALLLSSLVLQVANPQLIRYFLDTATAGQPAPAPWPALPGLEALTAAALAFLVAAGLYQVLTVAATYVGEDVGWTATNALRADLARHCLQLDMGFHNARTPGEMIERIDGDVANLAIFFATLVIRVLGGLLLLGGVLVALLFEDWRVSLALGVYAVVFILIIFRFREFATPHWKTAREASAELFGFIEEHLGGTEDLRSSGAADYVLRRLYQFGRVRLAAERRAGTMNIVLVMLWMGLFTLGQIIAFSAGYALYQAGLLTVGTVYLILYYTDAIYRPLRDITNEIQNLQKAGASLARIRELYTTPGRLPDGAGAPLPAGPLAVNFESVSFRYGERGRVLYDVSFALPPGQVLGVLGRTGSGKTTLTRLLVRLYDPDTGCIRLGDPHAPADLRGLRLADLRRRVGLVTQDVQLFRASVRDNLTFFDRSIPDARIVEVLETLGLGRWLARQPAGLATELQSGGQGLSAGEAQLLAFTRVFLKDPGLVILDEASSRLDPATERLIEQAIDRLLAGRTGLIIAHRLATVHRADHILILEAGAIREYGAYAALRADPASRFSRLLQTGLEEVLA